jgi:FkbM family methyltransferase
MMMNLENIVKKYNLQIEGVIHIGAHHGQEYKDYEKQGIENMIFFEPTHDNFIQLMRNLPIKESILLFNIALGNESGEKEMWVETANKGQSCSLLEPKIHLKQYPKIKFDKKEKVVIDKLDNISFDHTKFNMINIDVQGFELEVFKGATETLKNIDIIYSEINFEEVYKDCCLVGDLDTFLGHCGFVRVLTDAKPKTWGDALYLKYN